MLQIKTFFVTGETVKRNGVRVRTLGENIDAVVNAFLATDPGKIVSVEVTPAYQGTSGDAASATVIYDIDQPTKGKK